MEGAKRILVATDGSTDAERAIDWLADFPLAADATVEVVNALRLPFPMDQIVALGWEEFLAENEHVVADARRRLEKRWPGVTARVLEGDARTVIVDAATQAGSDLIVLGARGLGAVASFLLGSVSIGVTRHAPCPVLVCRGPARPLKNVLIAVDGSTDARAAVEYFAALPLPAGLRVRLVGVVEPLRYPSSAPGFVGATLRAAMQDLENESRQRLEAAIAPLAAMLRSRVRVVDTTTPTGPPPATIVHEAEVNDSDLIVVGARGLGALERVALGSVSESVLRHAPCPVLVVRPPAPKEA
jgi:nucleotide-binding universal stress UspA family protein